MKLSGGLGFSGLSALFLGFFLLPRWKEDLLSTEFLLDGLCSMWSWAGTQLEWLWGQMCHPALIPKAPLALSFTCSSGSRNCSDQPLERAFPLVWGGFFLVPVSMQTPESNSSCQVTPQSTKSSAPEEPNPRRSQVVFCGHHFHNPKLFQLLASCSWGRPELCASASACLTGALLTNGGCNISVKREKGKEETKQSGKTETLLMLLLLPEIGHCGEKQVATKWTWPDLLLLSRQQIGHSGHCQWKMRLKSSFSGWGSSAQSPQQEGIHRSRRKL